MNTKAIIYRRRNGQWGASLDGIGDVGGAILSDDNGATFTVYGCESDELIICRGVSRAEAEQAIADDWRAKR